MAAIDHDALFKLLLTTFFHEFLQFAAPDLAAALDPASLVFLDKESFSDLIDPDRREADLVAQARLRDHDATILVHTEHQAQDDRTVDRRMLCYFCRFYDRYDLPIYPIVLCSYANPRRLAPDRHEVRIGDRTILDFHYQVVQLNQLDWRDFLPTTNPVAIALMTRMRIAPNERWRVKAACLRLLAGAKLNASQQRFISQFVDLYLPLRPAEEQAFAAEVATFAPAEQETVMEFVGSWERRGRAEGRKEGRKEGRAEGQRTLITRLLTKKVGTLPKILQQQVAALSLAQLNDLAEALLEFESQDALRDWLATVPPSEEDPPAEG